MNELQMVRNKVTQDMFKLLKIVKKATDDTCRINFNFDMVNYTVYFNWYDTYTKDYNCYEYTNFTQLARDVIKEYYTEIIPQWVNTFNINVERIKDYTDTELKQQIIQGWIDDSKDRQHFNKYFKDKYRISKELLAA